MVPLLVDQVRDRRSEADVQVTTDVRSAYAGRVSRRDIRKNLVFHFKNHFLSDFLKVSVDLEVSSISSVSDCPRVAASLNPR